MLYFLNPHHRCPFQLRHLNLSGTSIDTRGCREILEALKQTIREPGLQSLDLSRNKCLERPGAVEVATMLRSGLGGPLRALDLSGAKVGVEGAKALAETLSLGCCPNLEDLRLSDNKLGPQGGNIVLEALESCRSVKQVHMANACLGGVSLAALSGVWSRGGLPNLTHLDLSGNQVKQGMVGLCAVLGEGLVHLDLSDNSMGIEGAMALGSRLGSLQRLEHLGLAGNSIMSRGVQAIMPSLPPHLRVLDISNNNIDQEGGPAIAQRLRWRVMSDLRVVDLSNNYLAADGAMGIAKSLYQGACPNLEVLNLAGNAIGE